MALKGKKKTDYMREYMRKRRLLDPSVRPMLDPVIYVDSQEEVDRLLQAFSQPPSIDADGNPIYDAW